MVVLNHYLPKTLEKIFKNSIWFPKYIIATMVYNFFPSFAKNANSSVSHTDKSHTILTGCQLWLQKTSPQA